MYMNLVSREEIKKADKLTIETLGISEEVLIENAALALLGECPPVKSARIFCGKGNNGADGYALARHLFLKGTDVEIIALFPSLCKNAKIAEKLGIKITPFEKIEDKEAELYVDALFGTGLSKEITGDAKKLIDYINEKKGFKIACDIPSGIDADTGNVMGVAVKADKTVTFAFPKKGLYQYPGASYSGEVVLCDISIPKNIIPDTKRYLLDKVTFEKREKNSHKGTYGHILCVAGSKGMSGAAYMAGKAAIKSGCGLLTMALPGAISDTVSGKLPEAMTKDCAHNGKTFIKEAIEDIKEVAEKCNTLLIGPGIRKTEETAYLVREAITLFKGKNIVIDASALSCLSDSPEYFSGTVITPHPGEMAQILGCDVKTVQEDREKAALNFAEKYNCCVVLKGAFTVIAYPTGEIYYNTTGNPGMAQGGSGDVLAGLLASLMAQGIDGAEYKAPFIHGLSGDLIKERKAEGTFSATDLIKEFPKAIKKCMA